MIKNTYLRAGGVQSVKYAKDAVFNKKNPPVNPSINGPNNKGYNPKVSK